MIRLPRNTLTLKIAGLLLLTLLLCIPLAEIRALVEQRGASQREAADELARTHTGAQTLVGPLLVVPYVEHWTEFRREAADRPAAAVPRSKPMLRVVFPETLHLEGRLVAEERYRGIFRIPFYALDGTLAGRFPAVVAGSIEPTEADARIELRTPFIALHLSDLRGLSGTPALTAGGQLLRFGQGVPGLSPRAALGEGVHAPLAGAALNAWEAGEPVAFDLALKLAGQETLSVVPVAGDTTAHLVSAWAHPHFGGHFLAAERTVGDAGFDATWRVSSLVTAAQEQVRGRYRPSVAAQATARAAAGGSEPMPSVAPSVQTFDIALQQPLDTYALSTRAVKYGTLFIGLVLMAAFMAELFGGLRLHPVQYGLVGLSIALFFLLLLALSEKMPFGGAYALAAAASVALLAVYFGAVLGSMRRGAAFGGYVAVLYAALYGLLASESNALLLGALLVFGMVAGLMLATRRVDWHALGTASTTAHGARPADTTAPATMPA
ncbi:cell envelope integrity protein CreD [uncultured Xylophilus sp.]|uniref:cell envelope integrity protein CreD n=1 Tax=uncultured Xylophilus sp. TaxID=296832 RepID=UPI0025FF62C4|nr:cell envelope integrity protein CreD [uncultured Xylophilus sp.]